MCGISVLIDPAGSDDTVRQLRALHRPIRHRGPDGEGVLLVSADRQARRFPDFDTVDASRAIAGMAFRRLRILDLSDAAAQPMGSADGRVWLVFNGEIYNYAALRRQLAADGHSFRSTGDTEVILAAYEKWGSACFERLDGMFAIVILDLRNRRLLAARDRFGIKPLYWTVTGDRLLLASEAKQIVEAVGGRPRANAALVTKYLQGARLPNLYETFFEGIHAVPAGHWFEIEIDARPSPPLFRSYWELPSLANSSGHSYDQAVDELEAGLRAAVATHSVADVGVGSLLSGGLDSSVLTVMAGEERRRRGLETPTFSFGFRGAFEGVSELQYSDAVARASALTNFDIGFDSAWILDNIDRVVRVMEEPSLALAALAQHRVFELCRMHGTTVVLDGQGADEIFGGYVYHERLFVMDRFRRRRWKEATRELNAIAARDGRSRLVVAGGYLAGWVRAKIRRQVRTHEWLADITVRPEDLAAYADRGADPSAFYRQSYWDIKWGNVRLILDYADKNAMSWSIEARVPYFDQRVVELAMSLPDTFKIFAGERKRVLRDVGRRLLPAEVTERRTRMGFGTPDEVLIGEQLWPAIRDEITDTSFTSLPVFRRSGLDRLIAGFDRGRHRDYGAMWRLWALSRWRFVYEAGF